MKPVQYSNGFVEFYKLKFLVDERVLIPRPETELIVDDILKFIKEIRLKSKSKIRILDLGTGAGNIAIAIAKNSDKEVAILATDVSYEALEVAQKNAKLHGVSDRIEFKVSDLMETVEGNFDVIATNLPYIPNYRIPYLDLEVKDYEPIVALNGGDDGFELYRKLFEQLKEKNINFDLLIGEIDYTQADIAIDEANKFFPAKESRVDLDLWHKQRYLRIGYRVAR